MKLIINHRGYEIWARFSQELQVYELFFDPTGETPTGWTADSLFDAAKAAHYILSDLT